MNNLKTVAETKTSFSIEGASLVVLEGPHEGRTLPLVQEIVRIGRADWCDLSLPNDRMISTEHCELFLDAHGFRIRDLNSLNGIVVEEMQLFDAYLPPGTRFRVGQSLLQLQTYESSREIEVAYQDESGTLFGSDEKMRRLFSRMKRLAEWDVPVLLTGETGTGKSHIAQAIHEQSSRATAPLVEINCGALPASLIGSALFGYEKGAFTGAASLHKGFFEQAQGGTLFLDEIGELPLELQPKLLRVLERKQIRRLGGEIDHPVDFRLVCATHRELRREIKEGRFREDLFFRLAVVELEVPPLRERVADIPVLASLFLEQLYPNGTLQLSSEAMEALQSYQWPGNIRQLRNVLERAVIFLESDVLHREDLYLPEPEVEDKELPAVASPSSSSLPKAGPNKQGTEAFWPDFPVLEEGGYSFSELSQAFEAALLEHALLQTQRDVREAAKLLGISRGWLYKRINKHKLKTRLKQG